MPLCYKVCSVLGMVYSHTVFLYIPFPSVLFSLYPSSSLMGSLYWLPVHLMPKGNYAAGTATAASYLILPKGTNWCWQPAPQAGVLLCSFPRWYKTSTQLCFSYSQEQSQMLAFPLPLFPGPQMPLEMRYLISRAVSRLK